MTASSANVLFAALALSTFNLRIEWVTWTLGAQVPGNSGVTQFTVQVTTPLTNGTVIANMARMCATGLEPSIKRYLYQGKNSRSSSV